MLKYVASLCQGCDGCCVFCLYCDAWSCRCSCMGSMSVSSCRCCKFVCILWQFSNLNDLQFVNAGRGRKRLETTQPTRGGAVTAVWQTLCKLCRPLPPSVMGARLPCFGKLVMRTRLVAGNAPHKAGDVETNPGPTTTRKQVWMCVICHRQIQVRKQISIRCNRIEHWVHLRCTGIRLAQYTDTWTCHEHR